MCTKSNFFCSSGCFFLMDTEGWQLVLVPQLGVSIWLVIREFNRTNRSFADGRPDRLPMDWMRMECLKFNGLESIPDVTLEIHPQRSFFHNSKRKPKSKPKHCFIRCQSVGTDKLKVCWYLVLRNGA